MMELEDYCRIIPDFALYFSFAKKEELLYRIIFKNSKYDLLQIIALVIYEGIDGKKDVWDIKRSLKKEMYYYATRICGYIKKVNRTKTINCNDYYFSKKFRKCDVCGKLTNHYMYKSLIPGKDVCRICRNRLVRQDKKRNI